MALSQLLECRLICGKVRLGSTPATCRGHSWTGDVVALLIN